jgi:hypothetical protein
MRGSCAWSHPEGRLNMQMSLSRTPNGTIILSFSFICMTALFLLLFCALLLILIGAIGQLVGPLLVWMGIGLLKFVGGALLLAFVCRLVFRLAQTFWVWVRSLSFIKTTLIPWMHWGGRWPLRTAVVFLRWYFQQNKRTS